MKSTTPNTTSRKISTGQEIVSAVNFVESKILEPKKSPSQISAQAMADQAAGMMVQDMRSFLQANEQVITIGIGKAIALSVDANDANTRKGGIEALNALQKLMLSLPRYAEEVETVANSILTEFGDSKAEYLKNLKSSTRKKG